MPAVVLVLASMLMAIAPAQASAPEDNTACANRVVWDGREYFRTFLPEGTVLAEPLPGGELGECVQQVANPNGTTYDERVPANRLRRVEGISTRFAIGRDGDPGVHGYMPPGLWMSWRRHPLHASWRRDGQVPAPRCRKERVITGRIGDVGFLENFGIRGVERILFADVRTRYRGPRVGGVPFIREGDRARVTGCRFSHGTDPAMVLTRLRVRHR